MKKIRDFIQINFWRKRKTAYALAELAAIDFGKWICRNEFESLGYDGWADTGKITDKKFPVTQELYLKYREITDL